MSRPAFKPTAEQRHSVALQVCAGVNRAEIAMAIGVDQKTLAKHFDRELRNGQAIIWHELYAIVLESALKGKQASIRMLAQMNRDPRAPKPQL
jgi:hypothetical protein